MNKQLTMTIVRDLMRQIDDTIDTCLRAGLDEDDATAIVVRNLLGMAAFITIGIGADREQFLETCNMIYDEMCKGKERAKMGN
jgi:hypothetical protein